MVVWLTETPADPLHRCTDESHHFWIFYYSTMISSYLNELSLPLLLDWSVYVGEICFLHNRHSYLFCPLISRMCFFHHYHRQTALLSLHSLSKHFCPGLNNDVVGDSSQGLRSCLLQSFLTNDDERSGKQKKRLCLNVFKWNFSGILHLIVAPCYPVANYSENLIQSNTVKGHYSNIFTLFFR